MKRMAVLFLVLIIFAAGCFTAEGNSRDINTINNYQDIPGITDAEITAIESLKAKYGTFKHGCLLEPEYLILPDGSPTGFSNEFYTLISDLFGVEFKHTYCRDYNNLKDGLDSGEIDFIGISSPIPSIDRNFIVSDTIAGRNLSIYTLKGTEAIKTDADIEQHRIGFLADSPDAELITERYPETDIEIVEADDYSSAALMLLSGEIDAFVVDSIADYALTAYDSLRSRDIFPLVYVPVTLATANPELEPVITVLNKYLAAGGTEKFCDMYEKSKREYKKLKLFKTFTEEEKAYIANRVANNSIVDIGLQHDAYPVSFYNKNDKEFQGVAIDILSEITNLTDLQFDHVTTSTDTPISIILEKLKSGEISMMTQLLHAESRINDYLWSNAYLETNYALLSKSEFPNLEIYQVSSYKVGTVLKTAHEEVFETWFPNHAHQIKYDTTDLAFVALENGEIDLLMLSENMLLTQTNYREKPGFKINVDFYVPLESYFGFTKDEALLRSVVNKSMTYINLDSIGSKWINLTFDYTNTINDIKSRYLSIFTSLLMLLLIIMIFMFISNKRLSKNLSEQTITLSAIFSSIPDTVFCKDAGGVYTSCNPSFERLAGYPEKDVVDKTYAEIFKERIGDDGIELRTAADKRVLQEGISEIIEEEVIYPDGSKRVLETLKAPLIQNGKIVGLLGIGRDVTERKEIKTRLERIINTAQIVFIMTIDNEIIEANEYSKKHMGVTIGDDIRDFYGSPERYCEILKIADSQGTASNKIVRFKTAEGEHHRFLSSITPVSYEQKNAYVLWAIDIERDEQLTDRLRASQQTLQTIMDTLPMPVNIVDVDARKMVYGNNMFVEMMELDSAEEVFGLNCIETLNRVQYDGSDSELLDNYLSNITGPVVKEIKLLSSKNKVLDVRIHVAPIDYYGMKAVISFNSDLTHEKETREFLIAAAEREKIANQSKSLFLANMSHEIRTPMNGIIGMADLLLGERLEGRQLQYVKDIQASAESLLGIINDILDLSKISEGKLQINPVDLDLSVLLGNTISMIRFAAQTKNLEFLCDLEINSPEYVRLDDIRLNQILINLLSNAVKFTQKGYVKLAVKIENGNICFAVSDTGVGIRQEDIPLIFEVFGQVDMRKNRAIKGTGLGLSISKSLIELMGGSIRIESEYEKGTTFFVTIPYVRGDEAAVVINDVEIKYISAPTAQVLLVDDIQTNLTVGAGLLRMCDITADVAISGYEAIELVMEKDYDIVFMDHMMPVMDGIETMDEIRNLGEKYKNLPIIALTANAVNESKDLLLNSGMSDFLSKPIDEKKLVDMLNKWLPKEKVSPKAKSGNPEKITTYSEVLTKAAKIEGLNIELALSRIGGMQDVLEASIKQLAFSIEGYLKEMDIYLSGNDLPGFAIKAHGLKGALSNIGAARHSELAAELEIASKADNLSLCINKFSTFADTENAFAKKLKAIFDDLNPKDKPQGNSEHLAFKVGEAIRFLKIFEESNAMDSLKEINKFTFGKETDDIIKEAIAALGAFDYDKATGLLEKI